MNNFIYNIITEASMDTRIQDGVVNLKNIEHVQVVAEAMYDACGDESIVNEFVDGFVDEGKYPDRQAYNKDGWLVTFPSAEYKQRAIKKGTHYGSDPTHGKGGMHLYYKKRGKQKRQTQQSVSSTTPTQQSVANAKPTQPSTTQKVANAKSSPSVNNNDATARASRLSKITGGKKQTDTGSPVSQPADSTNTTTQPDTSTTGSTPEKSSPVPVAPTPSTVTPPTPNYVALSIKFANNKGWKEAPYGEWRDATGNTAAIVALSGEVVPLKNTDREELKIATEKNTSV